MLKIKNEWHFTVQGIFAFIVGCVFFPPVGLNFLGLGVVVTLYEYVSYLCFLAALIIEVIYVIRKTFICIDRRQILFFLCSLLLVNQLIPTVIYDGSIRMMIDRIAVLFGALMVVDLCNSENDKYLLVKRLRWLFVFFTVVNFLFVLLLFSRGSVRSTGGGDFWMFGQKNATRNILFPAIGFCCIMDQMDKRSKFSATTLATMTISLLTLILIKSGTSLAMIAMIFALMFAAIKMKKRFLGIKGFSIAFFAVTILLVGVGQLDIFQYFIVNIMGKSMTLSGRTFIWESAVAGIVKRPLLGWGIHPLTETGLHVGVFMVSHAHNCLLDILYKGGIIGAFLMIILFWYCVKGLPAACRASNKKFDPPYIITIIIGAFLISGTVGEMWNFGFFVFIFSTALIIGKDRTFRIGDLIR